MNIPTDLRYTKTHEWALLADDGLVTVGITDHAQHLLGDIVYLELPAVGRQVDAGEECAVVESVKAASDIYAPVRGEIVAVNQPVADQPERVNQDAYAAWLFKIRPAGDQPLAGLQEPAAYQRQIEADQA